MFKAMAKMIVSEKEWLFLSWYRQHFGIFPALRAYCWYLIKGVAQAPNAFSGLPVFIRPGTSDLDVYSEIFHSKEYELDLGSPEYIVDAGAYTGISSVYFACRYPYATVIAIEPEPANFSVLKMNAAGYPNIKTVNAGLWSRRTNLRITDLNVDTWAFRVVEDEEGGCIPAIGVHDVIVEFKMPRIDVLKINIEGSEIEVLGSHVLWLGSTRNLIIELHDRFRPGCADALDDSLRDYGYERSTSGESVVISNIHGNDC